MGKDPLLEIGTFTQACLSKRHGHSGHGCIPVQGEQTFSQGRGTSVSGKRCASQSTIDRQPRRDTTRETNFAHTRGSNKSVNVELGCDRRGVAGHPELDVPLRA